MKETNIKQELKEIKDLVEQALINARETTSPSISKVISDMTKKIDQHIQTHEEDVSEIRETLRKQDAKMDILTVSVEPAVNALNTAGNVRTFVVWLAGFILACGTIYGFFKK